MEHPPADDGQPVELAVGVVDQLLVDPAVQRIITRAVLAQLGRVDRYELVVTARLVPVSGSGERPS